MTGVIITFVSMVWLRRFVYVCALILLAMHMGCNEKPLSDTNPYSIQLAELIKETEDRSAPVSRRLAAALRADSLATTGSNMRAKQTCKKNLAAAYALVDSNMLARLSYRQAAHMAMKLPDYMEAAKALNNIGTVCNSIAEYDSALFYYGQAAEIFRKYGFRKQEAQVLINMGVAHKIEGRFEEAFSAALAGVQIIDSLGQNQDLAPAYTTLGNILKDLSRFAEAHYYLDRTLRLNVAANDSAGMAQALNNIGNIYKEESEDDSALVCYKESLRIKQRHSSSRSMGTTINNIADIYLKQHRYEKAETYLQMGLKIKTVAGDREGRISTLNKLADLYLHEHNVRSAEQAALEAFALMPPVGIMQQRADNAALLAQVYRRLGKYATSVYYDSIGRVYSHSVFNTEMGDLVSKWHIRYKAGQKEKELLLARQLQATQAYRLKVQRYFIFTLVFISILLSVLAAIIYRTAQFRKRAKQRVDTLMVELNHRVRNNLQMINGMLSLKISVTPAGEQTEVLSAVRNRIEAMGIIHGLLYSEEFKDMIDMKGFFGTLLDGIKHAFAETDRAFRIVTEFEDVSLTTKQAIPLGLIANELIVNMYKHARPRTETPVVTIVLKEHSGYCTLTIADNFGYWERNRADGKTSGIGLILTEALVKELDGTYNTDISAAGTVSSISFIKQTSIDRN